MALEDLVRRPRRPRRDPARRRPARLVDRRRHGHRSRPRSGRPFEVDETKYLLADAINRVPDRGRLVLTLYYYEGLTLSEIGAVLGVTESRVCQIHSKGILQLRAKFVERPTASRAVAATMRV
jgi:RNA polymerase sigma factor (sigma-70 family)